MSVAGTSSSVYFNLHENMISILKSKGKESKNTLTDLNLMMDFAEMARNVATFIVKVSGFSTISFCIFSKGFPKTSM